MPMTIGGKHPGGTKPDPGSERGKRRAEDAELVKLAAEARERLLSRTRLVLTAELIDEILAGVSYGNWPHVVAQSLGVPEHTYRGWVEAGENAWLEGQQTPELLVSRKDPEALRVELYLRVRQAEAAWETDTVEKMLDVIEVGSKWPGRMTMLQRRFPARWGVRDATSGVSGGIEALIRDLERDRQRTISVQAQPAQINAAPSSPAESA